MQSTFRFVKREDSPAGFHY